MSAQHRIGSRTANLETSIMDLADRGYRPSAIAERLGEKPETVQRIYGYMSESSTERTTRRSAVIGSAALLKAVLATGRIYA